MKYFSIFPKVTYDIQKNNQFKLVTNIFKRFRFNDAVNNLAIFYQYQIQEGDRPDTIAEKLYGDPTDEWIILYTNQVINPLFDWPLDSVSFENYINDKFGSPQLARGTIHHYEKIIQREFYTTNNEFKPERYIWIDEITYNTTPIADRRIVYQYDYEYGLNESKRTIHLIDPKFIQSIKEQATNVFENARIV